MDIRTSYKVEVILDTVVRDLAFLLLEWFRTRNMKRLCKNQFVHRMMDQ